MKHAIQGRVRIGGFELDLKSGELRSVGSVEGDSRVLLREQPFQVLRMLIERGGKIVTREEIKSKLWPNDTVVDFDHSINTAIKVLRRALGDSADRPQYIETLARRGYRLLSAIEWLQTATESPRDDAASPPVPESASLIGKKVSHYRVLEVIGGGGMGMVYKAEDLKLGRQAALKFLPEELASDPVTLERFEREAQTASALNHPNICTIYEIEEHEGQPFIVMELLEGETLRNRIAASEPMAIPVPALLDIAIQICNGLQAAHDKAIIHRDIKPANFFLTKQGTVKILDFGLAKLAASRESAGKDPAEASPETASSPPSEESSTRSDRIFTSLTRPGTTAGTAGYMSPEQVRKERLDVRTDLFSFGMVLYEMAAGRRAFEGETVAAIHDAILNQMAAPAHDLNSIVPRALDAVITKALEKDRSRRYQSAAEMREDLERVRWETLPARLRMRRWLAAAALLVFVATGSWLYLRYRNRVTLSPTDAIVLADISNHTGDPVFDDALNAALRYGLEQTPYLNVLAIDKVFATLGLLKLPPTTKLTPEVARQVCLRTNSKMVLTSSIADAGNRFRIELTAIECQSGTPRARLSEDVASRNEVVHVLGVSAAQLRHKLGEPAATLAEFNKPLEEATSSSLEALQAGTVGYKHHVSGDFLGAIPYYQRAIELDPNFALAYEALWAANSNRHELALANAAITKGYELRARMTEPARLRAEYQYYDSVTGELEKAYRVLLESVQTFPRDTVAHNNLARCLSFLGQPDEAAAEAREAARLHPSPWSYFISTRYLILAGRLNEAKATLDEAQARKFDTTDLHLNRTVLAFLQNDQTAVQEQWKWVVGKPDAQRFLALKSAMEGYYGHLRSAHQVQQQAINLSINKNAAFGIGNVVEALRDAEVGNTARAKNAAIQALKSVLTPDWQLDLALAFARAGEIEQAKKLADAIDHESPLNTTIQNYYLPTIRAAIKLHVNDPASAVEILQPVLKYDLAFSESSFDNLYPAYIRGLAYLQMRYGRLAAAEFQKLFDHPGIVGTRVTGALAHLQLARAEKMMGDQAAARKSYEDFLTLWKDADSDIPILKQAKAEYAKLH